MTSARSTNVRRCVMDPVLKTAEDRSSRSRGWDSEAMTSPSSSSVDVSEMRAELERLRQREAQIMTLIGCKSPEKLMHDLRNVLNELQLLRMLADADKS